MAESRASLLQTVALYGVAIVLAACSILYELTIAQKISLLAANTVIWYSVTVGLFLLGLGLGAFLTDKLEQKMAPWQALFRVEVALTALGALAVPLLHAAHMVYSYCYQVDLEALGIPVFFVTAFSLALAIGTLTGIELPMLLSIGRRREIRHAMSVLLGLDYLGSLVGALIFPLLLVPFIEPLSIGFYVAAVNGLCAFGLAVFVLERKRTALSVSSIVTACLVVAIVNQGAVHQYFLQRYFYYIELGDSLTTLFGPDETQPDVYHASSPYQKINLAEDNLETRSKLLIPLSSVKLAQPENADFPVNRILTLNGRFQLSSSLEEIYHEFFAHVPLLATGARPMNVLVLGAGDGLLIRELIKYPDVQITHVDLDGRMLEIARTQEVFLRMNQGALQNPRVHTIEGDGYYFIRNASENYDAIFIDFPNANDYNLARLYSREFFHSVREHLNPNGFAVFDATGIDRLLEPDSHGEQRMKSSNNWAHYYHTLRAAGFDNSQIHPFLTTLTYNEEDIYRILAGDPRTRADLEDLHAEVLARSVSAAHRERMLDGYLADFAKELLPRQIVRNQHGFILLTAPDVPVDKPWRKPDFPLYVLTQARFQNAFAFEFPLESAVRTDLVNSIFRPTFPTDTAWRPKLPY